MILVWQARGLRTSSSARRARRPAASAPGGAEPAGSEGKEMLENSRPLSHADNNVAGTLRKQGVGKPMIKKCASWWLFLMLMTPPLALAQEGQEAGDPEEAVAEEGEEFDTPAKLGSVTVTAMRLRS